MNELQNMPEENLPNTESDNKFSNWKKYKLYVLYAIIILAVSITGIFIVIKNIDKLPPKDERNILGYPGGSEYNPDILSGGEQRYYFEYNGDLYYHQPGSISMSGVPSDAADIKIVNGDPSSFEIIDSNFAKDKNQVYYWGSIVEKSDLGTFEPLDWPKAKDKNYYFNQTEIAGTIEQINEEKNQISVFIKDGNAYYRDENGREKIVGQFIDDIKNPVNSISYKNVKLSPNKKFIAMSYVGWEYIGLEIYNIVTEVVEEVEQTDNNFYWLDDNRLRVEGGCGMGISCGIFESISANEPWLMKLVEEQMNTYENFEFGISFKYPVAADKKTENGLKFGWSDEFEGGPGYDYEFRAMRKKDAYINSLPRDEELTIERILNRESFGGKTEQFKVNGYDAVRFENLGICDGPEITIFTDNYVYDFTKHCGGFEELNKIVNSIIFYK